MVRGEVDREMQAASCLCVCNEGRLEIPVKHEPNTGALWIAGLPCVDEALIEHGAKARLKATEVSSDPPRSSGIFWNS